MQLHVNTYFVVTGWMLCVIPQICKDVKDYSNSDHRKQDDNGIKTLFNILFLEEMAVTQDIFWTEYTYFDNNNGSFGGDEFICKTKDIRDGKSNLWHQKYELPFTKVLVFCCM